MKRLLASISLLFLVSACSGISESFTFDSDLATAESLSQPSGSFNEYLRLEYINGFDMAKGSAGESDWRSAGIFVRKAIAAGQGNAPLPEETGNWRIGDSSELDSARGELVNALLGGGREAAPQDAAIAQARYDCWVEEVEEGFEPDDIAKCRDEFWDALRRVQAAMGPVAQPAPPMAPPARDYLVYFDFDRSDIRADSAGILQQVLGTIAETGASNVLLFGNADRSGSSAYNLGLSQRRADAVSNWLQGNGVSGATISSTAQGEDDPRVSTPDGVREQENRNVQIRLN